MSTPNWTPMVPRVKDLLVKALRSGDYKQTVSRMRVTAHSGPNVIKRTGGIGHCCLGVLTDVAVKEGFLDHFAVNEKGQCPLVIVREWAGMTEPVQGHLMRLNDGKPSTTSARDPYLNEDRSTFAEIATWIEHNL